MSGLPQGWIEFTLKDLGGTQGGKTPSKSVASFWSKGTIPWTSPKDMKSFLLKSSEDKISETAIKDGGMRLLPKNSVLFVTRSGILAHTFPVALTEIETTINQDIKAITPNGAALPKYLAYLLKGMQREILDSCSKDGTTVASVETDLLEQKIFPLAPLPEQKRIADKLDALLARVDAARERLDRVPMLLKRFRQSVLAAATSGALTEDWRSGSEAAWEASTINDVIGDVGVFSDGDWVESKDQDPTGSNRLIQLADIGDGYFVDKSNRFMNDEQFSRLDCTELVAGDVLVARMPEPLGRACLMPRIDQRCATVVDVAVIRPMNDAILPTWLMHYLNSPQLREEINLQSAGTTRKRISRGNLGRLGIMLPPPAEQREIVRRVEALFALADKVQAQYEAARARVDKLTPALLAKAFRGELVPQDPTDEPASVLLERLRAAKVNTPAKAYRAKRRKARSAI